MSTVPLRVPFNRPACLGRELEYVGDAFASGHISGDGPYTRRATRLLEEALGTNVLLTTSCTHALEMAALLLDVGPGDEIIVPAFTFTSTINAFVLRGATPVFVDVVPETLNIDPEATARAVTPRTKAIVAVHYGGVACDLDALSAIVQGRPISLVEDNAHGLFGTYKGKALGTFGRLATLSFHETKNFTCGEGGALLINDPALRERAEILREKGTDRSKFFRGEVNKYEWVDIGSSYVLSDLLAAVLLAQLEKRDEVQEKRRCLWTRYRDELGTWARANGVTLPAVPGPAIGHAYHLFHLLMPSDRARDGLIAHLKARGIMGVFHYLPLNKSPMGRKLSAPVRGCPVAEDVSGRLVRLPFFTTLNETEFASVIEAVRSFTVSQ